jgi:transmembrane sensor
MTRTDKNQHNGAIPKEVLEQFHEVDHPDILAVWEQSKSAKRVAGGLTTDEIEDTLTDVHEKMAPVSGKKSSIAGRIPRYTRYLVAAIALIVAGTLFFFVPRTATVPYGEMATLELPDGSQIEMNSGTTVRYSRLFRFTDRTIELNGEAYFTVEDHGHPFIVEANGASVEVTGTRFNVRSWSDDSDQETTVTVSEGKVLFYSHQQKENRISLTTGESSRWNPQLAEPAEPEPVTVEDIVAWREQRFVFRDQPLISILRELERRYDAEIDLAADGVEYSTLTAYYSEQVQLESVLDDICTVKGLRYTRTTTGYRIIQ